MGDLDDLARRHRTDKGTAPARGLTAKGYTLTYERLLAERRHEPLRLLEIGVRTGASLRMWEGYLPRAEIVGVDIDPACMAHATERAWVVIGDQADPDLLDDLVATGGFDVIVDDGGHRLDQITASFGRLWPTIRPAGWYAIEDLNSFEGAASKIAAVSDLAGDCSIE